MLSLLITTTLACGFVGSTTTDDASAELARLAEQMAKVESYQFTSSTKTAGGPGPGRGPEAGPGGADAPRRGRGDAGGAGAGGRGGARDGAAPQPAPLEGVWKTGLPMQIKVGTAAAYKDGDRIVYADAEGTWKRFEMPTRGADGADAPGRGGERGRGGAGGEGADRPARPGGADREAMRVLRSAVGALAPHEQFEAFASLVTDVEKSMVPAAAAAEGQDAAKATPARTVYKGKLTEAGVAALAGQGGQGGFAGRGGRGGARGGEMKTTGTFTVEVVDGAITSAEFVIVRSGSFGDREFERSTTQASTFSNVGKARLEVPADALALFKD